MLHRSHTATPNPGVSVYCRTQGYKPSHFSLQAHPLNVTQLHLVTFCRLHFLVLSRTQTEMEQDEEEPQPKNYGAKDVWYMQSRNAQDSNSFLYVFIILGWCCTASSAHSSMCDQVLLWPTSLTTVTVAATRGCSPTSLKLLLLTNHAASHGTHLLSVLLPHADRRTSA